MNAISAKLFENLDDPFLAPGILVVCLRSLRTANPPTSLDVRALSTPLVALAAALGASLIAVQQFRLARQKLRLDLFDKRYAILDVFTRETIKALNQNDQSLFDEGLLEMNRSLPQARFLIDKETFRFLDLVGTRILEVRHSTWSFSQRSTTGRDQHDDGILIVKHNQNLQFLLSALTELSLRFEPSLSVDENLVLSLDSSAFAAALLQAFKTVVKVVP